MKPKSKAKKREPGCRTSNTERRAYVRPTLERYGSIDEITKVDVAGPTDGFSGNMNPSGT